MQKFTKYLVPSSIIVAGVIIAGFIYWQETKTGAPGEKSSGKLLTGQQAAEKAISYIDKNLTQGATPVSLVDVTEDSGLYRTRLNINQQEFDVYITKNGRLLFLQVLDLDTPLTEEESETESTIGEFVVSENEICKEGEKPIVYFFGTKTCPHCQWEHSVVENVAKKFEGQISFHNNMDSDADQDVFAEYSSGSVPTIVIGCRYYRIGSGENFGEAEEAKILTALICKLTDEKPADVCKEVQNLIDQAL